MTTIYTYADLKEQYEDLKNTEYENKDDKYIISLRVLKQLIELAKQNELFVEADRYKKEQDAIIREINANNE